MRSLLTVALFLLMPLAFAQSDDQREADEARQQQAFLDQVTAMVADLNRGSFAMLVRAIDDQAFIDKIFGLRLIDQRIKRDFSERMKQPEQFGRFIESQYAKEAKDGIKASLLKVESRGDRGRAVVRFDMNFFQVTYVEYDLRLDDADRLEVLDWTDYLEGYRMTDQLGLALVQAQPSPNAARKLVDFPSVSQAEVFQVIEVLKATRDRNFSRYFEILGQLNDRMKRQRVIIKLGLDATRLARKRREQRRVLEAVDRYYPNDVLFALPLLDYYFPSRQYQKAYAALIRVRDHLGIDDAVTNARLSSTRLVMNQPEEALSLAARAVEQEPGLELGWWSLFRARVAIEDYPGAVESLAHLQQEFGHELGPDELAKDRSLGAFVRSDAYLGWLKERDN